jgi:hypothetical protein
VSRALSREQIERLIEGLRLASGREEAEALIREANKNRDCSNAEAAYTKYREGLERSSHDGPSLSVDTVWGEREAKAAAEQPDADQKAIQSYRAVILHKAFIRFHKTGEPRPLTAGLAALQSREALTSVNPESIARLKEFLDAKRQPRRRGTPGGAHQRWRSALQVAALIVERRKQGWRIENCVDGVPDEVTEKFVDEVIADMNTWDATKRRRWLRFKPLTKVNVLALLREPKSRRL